MARKSRAQPAASSLSPPAPSKQLAVHEMLVVFRKTFLHEALLEVLREVDPTVVAAELAECAPAAGRQLLAAAGVRDELVFCTPEVLRHSPRLLGYYRLLLGSPQKQFYAPATGLSTFKRMEVKGAMTSAIESRLENLCTALNASLGDLIEQIAPTITIQDIEQLPLLVLGVQLDGALRNRIGADATLGVFETVTSIVTDRVELVAHEPNLISFLNNSDRLVTITLASDPDMVIEEEIAGSSAFKVAIEIKGGTDASNAHNRAGEAEKSHRKVGTQARDFWTIISLHGIQESALRTESPTTREWFDVSEVVARTGPGWLKFTSALSIACGI